jgi:hypothetical protein
MLGGWLGWGSVLEDMVADGMVPVRLGLRGDWC